MYLFLFKNYLANLKVAFDLNIFFQSSTYQQGSSFKSHIYVKFGS